MNYAANTDVMREAAGLLVEAHDLFNDKLTALQRTRHCS